jgi:hypothetical protein
LKKINLLLTKLSALFLLCFSLANIFAQNTPSDSTIVRKQFSLPNPVRYDAFYDVQSNMYYLYPKVGNMVTGNPVAMTPSEYMKYIKNNQLSSYYREKSNDNNLLDRKDQTDALKRALYRVLP